MLHYSDILTTEEMKSARNAFTQFDADSSGTIDQWELQSVLQSMGQSPTQEEPQNMISEVDDNDSGTIDFTEFLQVCKSKAPADISWRWDWYKTGVDAAGGAEDLSGAINSDLMIRIIKGDFGLNLDIEKLLAEIDTSGDGRVDYDEFKALFQDA